MFLRGFGDFLHGFDNARICAAAADVALQRLFDLRGRGMGILAQQGDTAHNHSRRAVSTLEGFGVEEGLLDGMEAAGLL
jgi:hypothetical protein